MPTTRPALSVLLASATLALLLPAIAWVAPVGAQSELIQALTGEPEKPAPVDPEEATRMSFLTDYAETGAFRLGVPVAIEMTPTEEVEEAVGVKFAY